MTDDEMIALLDDHRVSGAAPGRQAVARGRIIDEIGERAIDGVDAWIGSRGGTVTADLYDLPASLLEDAG